MAIYKEGSMSSETLNWRELYRSYYPGLKGFLNDNARSVKALCKRAVKICALKSKYEPMTNEELQAQTGILKERLKNGEKLNDILNDAFAVIREAGRRVLNMEHFPVQLMGGIAIFQGRIAEMGTGEGKTLVATLPAYLEALSGEGVHVVTVNDYLASRDAAWMGKIYNFLGVSVGVIVHEMDNDAKKAAYNADITYCTNSELGFDFLRDNMVVYKKDKVQRVLNFAIVDEVDSILIDEARTPLIISGRGDKSGELYLKADSFARTLSGDTDYTIEEKERTIMLTEEGVEKAEKYFKVENLTDLENSDLYHHIQNALKAHELMKKDRDYIVSDGEILIVDEFTGRVMIGRRYSDGLHQAIEAKERVMIKNENKTLATITYQNFFRMYKKLSGMTGTAKTEEEEFRDIYSLDVVTIPPNKPSQRLDEHDVIYKTRDAKLKAIVEEIERRHEIGQPILVGTVSVEKSEELSTMLRNKHIPHNVLNAKNHKMEAEIVAQAGKYGQVTIATNMAGRGTDIVLGGNPEFAAKARMEANGYSKEIIEAATSFVPTTNTDVLAAKEYFNRQYEEFKKQTDAEKQQVLAVGGLRIIGTERHDSRRIDNQLRGRSGRQGDPGSTQFFISCEDDVARIFGGDRLKMIMSTMNIPEDQPIVSKTLTRLIESAQRRVEGRNYSIRKQVLSYDDVMNAQREIIYKQRGQVLDGMDVHDQILDMMDSLSEEIIGYYADYKQDYTEWDYKAFNDSLENKMVPKDSNLMTPELAECFDIYKLKDVVMKAANASYEKLINDTKEQLALIYKAVADQGHGDDEKLAWLKQVATTGEGYDFGDVERVVLLTSVDRKWMTHIDDMDTLRHGIGLRGYGQRDPVISYREEGWGMFDDMVEGIHSQTASTLLKMTPFGAAMTMLSLHGIRIRVDRPKEEEHAGVKQARRSVTKEIGRNDPCPCGSGLKFKNCKCKEYHPDLYK